MQLSQLEKEFLTLDASPMISRGRRLATITSPTFLLILRSIAVVICGILEVSLAYQRMVKKTRVIRERGERVGDCFEARPD
jgi:hypothetical protein